MGETAVRVGDVAAAREGDVTFFWAWRGSSFLAAGDSALLLRDGGMASAL